MDNPSELIKLDKEELVDIIIATRAMLTVEKHNVANEKRKVKDILSSIDKAIELLNLKVDMYE